MISDELLRVGCPQQLPNAPPGYELGVGFSCLQVITTPSLRGHLCQWATMAQWAAGANQAIKDFPKYPMTHRITSFYCEIPHPGGGAEHSSLYIIFGHFGA